MVHSISFSFTFLSWANKYNSVAQKEKEKRKRPTDDWAKR